MAPVMQATDVVGFGLYVEYQRPGGIAQVLLIPAGRCVAGQSTPMAIYWRQLTVAKPRPTWSSSASTKTLPQDANGTLIDLTDAVDARILADRLTDFASSVLDGFVARDWKPTEPLIVETTRDDLDAVRDSKTPYRLLGRVQRARLDDGRPKEPVSAIY